MPGVISHPPIFAELVVNSPLAPTIVVCLNAFPNNPLENVIPSLFSIYPALESEPPDMVPE